MNYLTLFDAGDVKYLADNLSERQLHKEIHNADILSWRANQLEEGEQDLSNNKPPTIVLALDGDEAGQAKTATAIRNIIDFNNNRAWQMPIYSPKEALYWEDFKKTCELALELKRLLNPRRTMPQTGSFSIQATKEKNDIVDVVGRYVKLRKSGKEYVGLCPFHSDKQPSFEVNPQKQLFYCFSCQAKGDVIKFIMDIERIDFKEAVNLLSG